MLLCCCCCCCCCWTSASWKPASDCPPLPTLMMTICELCGDEGFTEALIYCDDCEVYALHRYCLDALPATFDEYVVWYCESCELKVLKSSSLTRSWTFLKQNEAESFSSVQTEEHNPFTRTEKKLEERTVRTCSLTESDTPGLKDRSSQPFRVLYFKDGKKDVDLSRKNGLEERSFNDAAESIGSKNLQLSFHGHWQHEVNGRHYGGMGLKLSRQNGVDKSSFDEEAESPNARNTQLANCDFQPVAMDVSEDGNCQSIISYAPNIARPIKDPIWKGNLSFTNKNIRTIGLAAHLSSLACARVSEEAILLPGVISLQLLPRSGVWPKTFQESGLSDQSIALYFFPHDGRHEKAFDSLVSDMIHLDLAMRAVMENADLLIFASTMLPMEYWRFQSKYYLWGVFKGKQQLRVATAAVPEQEKGLRKATTWSAPGPVSPLSLASCTARPFLVPFFRPF